VFGDARLGDLPRRVVVATFALDEEGPGGQRTWKPKFFHNFPEPGTSDRDQLVADIAMRTCAAPTYFPIYQGYVDGGVAAVNPAMCGLAQALHPGTGGQRLEDVALLSVGTGVSPKHIATHDGDWGYAQWAPHLLSIMFDGVSGIADYQCRQLLGERYLRYDPLLAGPIGLDDTEHMGELVAVADGVDLDGAAEWLETAGLAL
jgi:patatin-like phospholipase/acyl hydrolase